MPTPKPYEKKDDYIARCIPIVIADGTAKSNEQAYAICSSKWDESKMSTYEKEIRKHKAQEK